jgi:hypothetical protein
MNKILETKYLCWIETVQMERCLRVNAKFIQAAWLKKLLRSSKVTIRPRARTEPLQAVYKKVLATSNLFNPQRKVSGLNAERHFTALNQFPLKTF